MSNKLKLQLVLLGLFTLIVGAIAYPNEGQLLRLVGVDADLSVRRGLDLRGGVELVYEADIPEDRESQDVLNQIVLIIQGRVNPGGASEAVVKTAQNDRIIVQLPDEDDPQAVIDRIGRTASLEFYEVDPSATSEAEQIIPTNISGEDVSRAEAVYDNFNRPIVSLQMRGGESTRNFGELTTRIYNNSRQILVLLDGEPVFGPAPVQQPILTGEAQLTGIGDIGEAQVVADLIEGGALPVPIEIASRQTIGPSLGANATQASLVGGGVGLLSLIIFLLAVYRLGGLAATFMITVYAATMITIFKLSATPLLADFTIVLTLAGIAGFIMSIAVAADANILVLERLREERAAGLKPVKAVEEGYNHAWSSIRDASVATMIITIILYVLARQFGELSIQGFALVLGIGVLTNVASVSIITRTVLRGLAKTRWSDKL
ncbi:MAG: MMPL family transporter [Candidatus Saccharimonadales bacterium]